MRLIHTILFLTRENQLEEDLSMARAVFHSLEGSTYKTVVVYNQGYYTNDKLRHFLSEFELDIHVIGDSANIGIPAGRQSCFNYIWTNFSDTEFISELHMDMILSKNWEDPLIAYLVTHDEPMVCSGIIDREGNIPVLGKKVKLPQELGSCFDFLLDLREDKILQGLTHPCIHVAPILKEVGGYDPVFLKGKQCFEDDSLLLGYYYYYGTRKKWYPKINFNSVSYHAVAGQRLSVSDDIMVNLRGIIRQYGAMGIRTLSDLRNTPWHKAYFMKNYRQIIEDK